MDELPGYDAIIFGTPTRFGNMCAQMRNFLDQTGGLWLKGALIGKVGSVFTSTATQHGGQETTITSFHTTLLHHGMIIVGVPYSCQEIMNMSEITGGSPYGASTLAGGDGSRQPSANELKDRPFPGNPCGVAKKLSPTTARRGTPADEPKEASAMKGFVKDIESLAIKNKSFRKVLYTAKHCQLVLMALNPKEEIGEEVHNLDQFFRVEEGTGEAVLDGVRTAIHAGFAVLVPAGAKHNIVNTGTSR